MDGWYDAQDSIRLASEYESLYGGGIECHQCLLNQDKSPDEFTLDPKDTSLWICPTCLYERGSDV